MFQQPRSLSRLSMGLLASLVALPLVVAAKEAISQKGSIVSENTTAENSTADVAARAEALEIKDWSSETPEQKAQRMAWFGDAKFGMFIHWGVYAQPAGVWKGEKYKGCGEWLQDHAQIPAAEYQQLAKTFHPTKYNPEAWVQLAKAAGMKYIVITTRHHDGFALYDSAVSDWDIAATPYKKDLLAPLAAACRKHGMKLCFYYSLMDWVHPDYGDKDIRKWRGNAQGSAGEKPDMAAYVKFMKAQLYELLTNYGDIGIVWFDGEWEGSYTHAMGVELYNYCRTLQPNTIVNNRVDKGRSGMAGMTKEGGFVGDYGTPEQEVPSTGFAKGLHWESCMTMNDTWGFVSFDDNWKSNTVLIRHLIDIASKGGNFLLNVGPTAEGEIPAPSVERLQAIGAWMERYGKSIHGTEANPLKNIAWDGRCTKKVDQHGKCTLYLHLYGWPQDSIISLTGLEGKPAKALCLGNGQELRIEGEQGSWKVILPAQLKDTMHPIAEVIELVIED